MGNCLRHESEIIWGGENWGSPDEWGTSPEPEKIFRKDIRRVRSDDEDDEMLLGLGEKKQKKNRGLGVPSSSVDDVTEEVKIKITKKELEELVGKVDEVQGLSEQQMLARQRSWVPALQSIPE